MTRWVILLTLFTIRANAQTTDAIVKVSAGETIAEAGSQSIINVQVEVMEGYHIQANKVKDPNIIPTKLELTATGGLVIKTITYPRAKKFKLEGTDTYLDVYDGKFEIKTSIKIQKQLPKGTHRIEAKLSYQACNSNQCLFPRSVEFPIAVEIRENKTK